MVIMNRVAPPVANQVLPAGVIEGLMAIVAGAKAIETWLVNSNTGTKAQITQEYQIDRFLTSYQIHSGVP